MIIWGLNHIWENFVFRFRSLIYQIAGSNFESVCTAWLAKYCLIGAYEISRNKVLGSFKLSRQGCGDFGDPGDLGDPGAMLPPLT